MNKKPEGHPMSAEQQVTTEWLEDELMEVMRIAVHDQADDDMIRAMKLHGIRLLVEGDVERYEALFARWQARHPNAEPLRSIKEAKLRATGATVAWTAVDERASLLDLYAKWRTDLRLPFGTDIKRWHSFGVTFEDYVATHPLPASPSPQGKE